MNRFHRFIKLLKTLNFFDDDTNDEHLKANQIISTRIYIVVFVLILIGFTMSVLLPFQTITVNISNPDLNQYEQLFTKYPNTLQCPCQNISISYKQFINIQPTYHEICSSDFVSQRWLEFLYEYNMSYYFQLDFRHSATAIFQSLQTLCQQAKETIDDSLADFYSIQLITSELISNETFTIQTNFSFEMVKETMLQSMTNLIDLVRNMIFSSGLFSAQETHRAIVPMYSTINVAPSFLSTILYYYELSNQTSTLYCFESDNQTNKLPAGIYSHIIRYNYSSTRFPLSNIFQPMNSSQTNATVILPGLFIGCLPMESLLKSTLECFYNQTCLDIIISYTNRSNITSNSFSVLNQSRFLPSETTFKTLMGELFVEEWKVNTSYIQYFKQCQPSFCQYSIQQRNSVLYIFTMIISLYAGLKTALKLIIPILISFIRKNRQQQQILHKEIIPESISFKNHLYLFSQKVIISIHKFNIFNNQSTDEHMKKNQCISTRIYFLLLFLLLTIFGLYTALIKQSKIITIYNPTQTQFTNLVDIYSNNLQCPCSQISIRYDKFISVEPFMHQVCSSLLVSSLWNKIIWFESLKTIHDFRSRASAHFNMLQLFCEFTNITIMNSLTQFYRNEYVTSQTINPHIFHNQIISFIELFQTTTQQSIEQILDMTRQLFSATLLISGSSTNVFYSINNTADSISVLSSVVYFDDCPCSTTTTCKKQYDIQSLASVVFQEFSGIYVACSVADSVLFSTLECFFDEKCISRMKSYMNSNAELYKILHAMPIIEKSHYPINTSIGVLIENLFIEDWNANYSYEKYYVQCRPSYCSYTIQHRPGFVYVLSQMIAIFGGLSIILKFCVPILINNIRKNKKRQKEEEEQQQQVTISRYIKLRHIAHLGKQSILQLNIFETKSRNDLIIRRQRLSTRLYFIILVVSLGILILYTVIHQTYMTKTVPLNTREQYDQLQIHYPTTLHCKCNQISTEYKNFIQISLSYHKICSSNFVKQEWINYLFSNLYINQKNFRATAASQFLILSLLCQLTKQNIETSIDQFYASKFLTSEIISLNAFENQIDAIINSLKISMPRIFKRTLDTIRGLIQSNSILTGYQTNWKFTVLGLYTYTPMYTNPQSYGNSCSCALSAKCVQPAIIIDEYPHGVPGLLIGCYPLEAILQSSLECLYDQKCVDTVIQYMNMTNGIITVTSLNSTLLSTSDFQINETIEQMVNRLFIDRWYINQSYEKYYKQCAARQCTYSYIQTFDILYVITTVLGLYGGLSIILKIIVPLIIYSILRIIGKKSTHITPVNEITNNAE